MHAHRAFGAEFLAAEAADADLFVDHGALIHDPDRVRRADVAAFAAANADLRREARLTAQGAARDAAEHPAESAGQKRLELQPASALDALEIGHTERVEVARDLVGRVVQQAEFPRGLKRRHGHGVKADQTGTDAVEPVAVRPCQQRADVARRPGGRAVALHGGDGVDQIEPGLEITVQIDDHPGKIQRVGIAEVVLRLRRAGHDAEQVLRRGGERHHAVAFQLAEADDRVGVVEIGGVGKAPRHKGLRKGRHFVRKLSPFGFCSQPE